MARKREPRPNPVLVSTTAVEELRQITHEADVLRIGAAVTLIELANAVEEKIPFLADAINSIASAQIRNSATVGGNLAQEKRCWFFRNGFSCYKRNGSTSPCYAILGDHRFQHAVMDAHRCQAVTPSDLGTALVALDADVVVASDSSTRMVAMGELYTGPGEIALGEGEYISEVVIPSSGLDRRGGFAKLGLYEGDFAAASATVSARLDDGIWRDVRVVLGAVAPTPWRAKATELALEGTRASATTARQQLERELDRHAHPLPGNGWKLDAVAGLFEQAVEALLVSK